MLINWGGNLIKDLLESLEDAHFSDVKIEACDGEILANRTVLSMRSSYFRSMFNPDTFVERRRKE